MSAVTTDWGDYRANPPPNTFDKPAVVDFDHITWRKPCQDNNLTLPCAATLQLPWKAFTRGYHLNFYNQPFEMPDDENANWQALRKIAGSTVKYANRVVNLASMNPSETISSMTPYALINPGYEYLVYQPESAPVHLNLIPGSYRYEWFDLTTFSVAESGTLEPGHSCCFKPGSIAGGSVLYVYKPLVALSKVGNPQVGDYAIEAQTNVANVDHVEFYVDGQLRHA